jgi:ankyrin repeat protein
VLPFCLQETPHLLPPSLPPLLPPSLKHLHARCRVAGSQEGELELQQLLEGHSGAETTKRHRQQQLQPPTLQQQEQQHIQKKQRNASSMIEVQAPLPMPPPAQGEQSQLPPPSPPPGSLRYLVRHGSLEEVTSRIQDINPLEGGADALQLEECSSVGRNILHAACEREENAREVLKLLFRSPAASIMHRLVNTPDKQDLVPLHVACMHGLRACVLELLRRGAHLDSKTASGATALHWACSRGHVEVVKLLAGVYGMDVECQGVSGGRPLHWAAAKGHEKIIDALCGIYCCEVDCRDEKGCTPLLMACLNGHMHIVDALVDRFGANIKVADKRGTTALHAACEMGHCLVVRGLIDGREMDPNMPDRRGVTPLGRAARAGRTAVIDLLLSTYKVDVCIPTTKGGTLVHLAAEGGAVESVSKFLSPSFDFSVEERNKEGDTPLLCAAWKGKAEMVKLLVENYGADALTVNSEGLSALHYACIGGHMELAELLMVDFKSPVDQAAADGSTPLHLAAGAGCEDILRLLILRGGANIGAVDDRGDTPLHVAASRGKLSAVTALVDELGAEVDSLNKTAKAPIDVAMTTAQTNVVEFLRSRRSSSLEDVEKSCHASFRRAGSWVGLMQSGKFLEEVSLNHVNVLPVTCLREHGSLPAYYTARKSKMLRRASDLPPNARILLVSHPWEAPAKPDPTGSQMRALDAFLHEAEKQGGSYEYVWAMYSCCDRNRIKPDFKAHLNNLATSYCRCDHVLVIPKEGHRILSSGPTSSDLHEFLSRGWCCADILCAAMLQLEMTVHFGRTQTKGGECMRSYQDVKLSHKIPPGAALEQAVLAASQEIQRQVSSRKIDLSTEEIADEMWSDEASQHADSLFAAVLEIASFAGQGGQGLGEADAALLEKARRLSISRKDVGGEEGDDVQQKNGEGGSNNGQTCRVVDTLNEVYSCLGSFSSDHERLDALGLLTLIAVHQDNKVNLEKTA